MITRRHNVKPLHCPSWLTFRRIVGRELGRHQKQAAAMHCIAPFRLTLTSNYPHCGLGESQRDGQ